MNKITLLLFIFSAFNSYAQSGTTSCTEEYAIVVASQKLMSSKCNIRLDYGQLRNEDRIEGVKKDDLKVRTFISPVDALNFMNSHGWELVNAYTFVQDLTVFHYVMKRKIRSN